MRFLPPATVLPTLLISPVWAAEFQVRPTLSVAQYYSDNINLAPRGQEQSDWVTQAVPGLTFSYTGAKLTFFARASADMLYHVNDGSFDVHPQWNGGTVGSMEILPQFLFLESNSSVAQYNNSVNGPLAANNINQTGNRSTVQTNTLSPFIRQNFGNEAIGEVRYSYSFVSSNSGSASNLSDSGSNRISAQLSSGPAYKLTGWSAVYSKETINYNSGQDYVLQSFTASARRMITPVLSLLASAGYEDNQYAATNGEQPQGASWNVGLNWVPTPRTNLTATTGRRYFGKTSNLDFSHRTRLTFWSVGYSEDITTARTQFLVPTQADTATYLDTLLLSRIPDPIARQKAVQDEIARSGLPSTLVVPVNFLTNQLFLQKSWRLSAGYQGPIHTFLMNFYTSGRETQTAGIPGAGDFSSGTTIDQVGGGGSWSWRITPLTSSVVSLNYSINDGGSGRQDNTTYLRVSLNTQLGPKSAGVVSYQRQQSDSNVATASYSENQVSAQLQVRF